MNWFVQNWYWFALGLGILVYSFGRRRQFGQPQAVDDDEGLVETDGDPSKRPRRRRGCC